MSYIIEIYVKKNCPYCSKARSFFIQRSLNFKEIFIDDDLENTKFSEMRKRSNGRVTVPQIFINNYHVGGADELIQIGNNSKKFNFLLYSNLIE